MTLRLRFLALLLAFLATGLVSTCFAQVELVPNTIRGEARFSNTDPRVLSLLEAPGDEGLTYLYVHASSLPDYTRSASSEWPPAATRLGTSYEITVDSTVEGLRYLVSPRASLLNNQQTYYFQNAESEPVVAQQPGPTLDFAECLGVLTVRFLDADGAPLAVDSGNLVANQLEPYREISRIHTIAAGTTEQRIYLRGDTEVQLIVTVSRGTSTFTDRIQYVAVTNGVMAPCDGFATVDIVVPDAGALGEVTGIVDMLGEFELSVDGYDPLDYPDYTSVVAQYGPFSNMRYNRVPGANFTTPSSGAFTLANLVPSTLDPASAGYVVGAQMYLRTNEAVQYFRSPALGSGANPPLVVTPGASLSLSNLFVIQPGYLRGSVRLQGPPESPEHPSLLRGLRFGSEYDADEDGIPDGIGIYGVYYSTVHAEGVNRPAPGASFTASWGYGYTGFKGAFNAAASAYDGHYELALGGLNSEPTLWNQHIVSVTAWSDPGVSPADYFYYAFHVTDTAPSETEVVPGHVAIKDAAYCLSEVSISFRSTESFYSPMIRFSHGSYMGVDFQGQQASYTVYVDPAYGTPGTQAEADTHGQVRLSLPQGTYRLMPYITPPDGLYATVGGDPIDLVVGCGQRIGVDTRLQLNVQLPTCAQGGTARVNGSVRSFGNQVSRVSWQADDGEWVTACEACGDSPALDFMVQLPAGTQTLTVKAEDELGGVSSVSGTIQPDALPPVIQCPADIVLETTRPCGAIIEFSVSASDVCDPEPAMLCTPPSGSAFPRGDSVVVCTATDAAGNLSECSFNVSVNGSALPAPTIDRVSPQLLGAAGGAQVTILGSGFTAEDEVLLDGVALGQLLLVSSGEIQGQAPALPSGAHELQIRRCGEIVARQLTAVVSASMANLLSFDPPQAFARGGNFATVRGADFLPSTQIRIGFQAPNGTENLLVNTTVSADGTLIIGQVPPLPAGELFGPRDVIAEDARGQVVLPAALTYLPNPWETDPQVIALRALEAACTEPPSITFRSGFPVAMNVSVRVPGPDAVQRSRHFLRAYKDLLRQTNPDTDLTVRRLSSEALEHVCFAQKYRGVPVFGGQVVVSLVGDEVLALTGSLLAPEPLDALGFNPAPTLSAEVAEERARAQLQLPGAPALRPAQLLIFDECVLSEAPSDAHLVWRVSLRGGAEELFIDAHNGAVVHQVALSHENGSDLHGFDLDIQDAENEANASDDWCFNLSNDEDVATEDGMYADYMNDNEGVLAYLHAQSCYAFFHRNFNWHSYDNDSSQLEIFIRADVDNASWNDFCELIQIREGFVDFEIIAHEFTHGVIHNTSELIYEHESGALNESYCDMMAIIADRETGDLNWLLGEGRTSGMGAIRNLENIGVDRRSKYVKQSVDDDHGGVHKYSGIPNRAGYFMIAGGMTNGVRVLPMSQDKVRMLKWEALRNLPDSAGFDAARAFELATAIAWARSGHLGFNQNDVCTVRNAWAAVEVGYGDADCNGSEDRPSDIDGDFWPDIIDNCRNKANPRQEDFDRDGRGDTCDNCPINPNPGQEDLDGDTIGDVCDPDLDADGCRNDVDQHPNSPTARSGSYTSATCNPKSGDTHASEAGHHDRDGVADCADRDDDGDGTPDDQDPCPLVFGTDPKLCEEFRDCPVIPTDWWMACMFGGCNEFQARFRDRINPDPTRVIVFDQLQIVNETLYLTAPAGNTVQQMANVIAPRLAGGGFAAAAQNVWRVELWTRATADHPARLVAVVGDYDPAAIQLEQTAVGTVLAFKPGQNGTAPSLGATWQVGGSPTDADADHDQDGLPDAWELRYGLNPGDPSDADADLDGDGASNRAEFQAGTTPTDTTSVLGILGLHAGPQGMSIEFVAEAGRTFQLEKATRLGGTQWTPIGSALRGQGGVVTIVDPSPATTGHGFYRLRSVAE